MERACVEVIGAHPIKLVIIITAGKTWNNEQNIDNMTINGEQ